MTRVSLYNIKTEIASQHLIKTDHLFPKPNSERPSSPTKPDRLFPQIKQRLPLIIQNLIA